MDAPVPGRSNWARKAGGWGLLILGLAGCVLPILPGIPFALAGLLILARDYAWARSALRKAKRKVVMIRRRARAKRSAPSVVPGRRSALEGETGEP